MKKTLVCLLTAIVLLLSCAAFAEETVKITVMDSGENVLNELSVNKGSVVTIEDLGVEKEGYVIEGIYLTPAMRRPYEGTPIDSDTALFVAFKSAAKDERPWMLAGSFVCYPENNWGKLWPQDDFLLKPVEGEQNTFEIEVSMYKGDMFKIAVIGEGYKWSGTDSLDSRHVVKCDYVKGGEDVFDTGANIEVLEDGLYHITLVTDAETVSLCKINIERIGEAAPPPVAEKLYEYDLQVHGSFLGWDVEKNVKLTRNGDDYLWYGEFDAAEDGEFGIKNYASEAWFAAVDGANIKVDAGHYMVFVKLTDDNRLAEPIVVGTPAYYVVGTCGNKGWAADVNAENTAYVMTAKDDGTYELKVSFTDADTDTWTDGKVAFKIAYGLNGLVGNEYWYGDNGQNIMVAPGEYTITLDPATGVVIVE